MRKLVRILLCLAPLLAEGQTLTKPPSAYPKPRGALNQGGSSLALFIPFAQQGCWPSGDPALGGASVTRTTTRTCSVGGVTVTCAAGSACVEPTGLLVEGARTNSVLQSEDLSTSWVAQQATIATNVAAGPDGNLTADRITSTASSGVSGVYQGVATSGTQAWTFSAWVKAGTQGAAASIGVQQDGTLLACTNISPTSTLTRYSVTGSGTFASIAYGRVYVHANCGSGTAVLNDNVIVASGQLELGAFASSYVRTTTVAVTRNADQITVPTPTGISAQGCADVEFMSPAAGTVGATRLLGSGTGDAALLYFVPPTQIGVYDGVTQTLLTVPAMSAGTFYRARGFWAGAAQTISSPTLGTSASGAYSGAIGNQASIYLGSNVGASASFLYGYMRNFKVYRKATCR